MLTFNGRETKAAGSTLRRKGFIRVFNLGSGFAIATTILGFWATPRIVAWIGVERYGLSRALIDLFGYLTLFELGLAGASRPVLSREIAGGDPGRKAIGFAIVSQAYWRATRWKMAATLPLARWRLYFVRIQTGISAGSSLRQVQFWPSAPS